ncbi:MAG TPA: hypothetical protein PKK26_05995 [Candidatus Wallbacteria bacterium]|nr:hypothetical protein [Candidatus Wallbacteria bacterium]
MNRKVFFIPILFFMIAFNGFAKISHAGEINEYVVTSGEVIVSTDKNIYAATDNISVSIKNASASFAYIHANSVICVDCIERHNPDGSKTELKYRNPGIDYDIGPPSEFKIGETFTIECTAAHFEKISEGVFSQKKLTAGKYGIRIIYQIRPAGGVGKYKWLYSNSNEFEIK